MQTGTPSSALIKGKSPDLATDLKNSCQVISLDVNLTPESGFFLAIPPGIESRASDFAVEQFDSFSAVDPIDLMLAGGPFFDLIKSRAPDPSRAMDMI